ncbi:hypothetical protein L1987_58935 [Smallanthus sonchifolius]|uniref:Uncharacterized protein n=1 Tax=Smallanthus sonchifolius TaxID=185202 RepID=A0ACB9D3T5_9ASTR|nr:hypothetical protein L1987_58935 [Smallanthus sonchifolius]
MAHNFLILLTIFVSLTVTASGRLITNTNSSTTLINDGVHESILRLNPTNEIELCEQTYGFMPCTTTVLGNVFLILGYGYLMFLAATYLSAGSELMLEILGLGIFSSLFLPILGALPDAMLILEEDEQFCPISVLDFSQHDEETFSPFHQIPNFIRDELITTKGVKHNGEFESRVLSIAKSWVRGEGDGSLEWGMDERVNWNDFEDDQEAIGIEMEKIVLNYLLDELSMELVSF